ncbi:MAG: 4Fe-4S dicluster domain-containing protein [Candidatus Riflebacteria bacterium]|nr:4Fe-4S dicluster domain-containing protein [Candidatus Riflebacteria bacterium]
MPAVVPANRTRVERPDDPSRRRFLRIVMHAAGGLFFLGGLEGVVRAGADPAAPDSYDWTRYYWAYAVDTARCVGCGSCMRACRAENNVPDTYYRTWVERYEIAEDGEAYVQVALGKDASFETDGLPPSQVKLKAFFVPKLCNHCEQSVCSQVCPVGATYLTPDGVSLVDPEHCVGCGYCIQACPYGTRFKNPVTHTADKCTLCYHRISRGLKPACVQDCPVGARMYGNLKDSKSELKQILRARRYTLLKPELGTHPKCYYIGLDHEV